MILSCRNQQNAIEHYKEIVQNASCKHEKMPDEVHIFLLFLIENHSDGIENAAAEQKHKPERTVRHDFQIYMICGEQNRPAHDDIHYH